MLNLDYEFIIKPRFSDTDSYGIMHHSSYFKWFEEARLSFSKEVLYFENDLLNGRYFKFPVIDGSCRYKESVLYGDTIKIYLKFSIAKVAKINFDYKAINTRNNKICALGKTTHMFLDENNRICLNIPELFLEKFKDIESLNN